MKLEPNFMIKSYGKSELAQLYLPEIEARNAQRTLNRWIERCCNLKDKLEKVGYRSTNKIYTPKQVQIIIDYLGEPGL